MENIKMLRKSLISSVISLMLCFTMLVGSTFAWFTSSVVSENNVIKSGSIDVAFSYREPGDTEYKDASSGPIFNSSIWEPGRIDAKILKIENIGSLAFRYKLVFSADINVRAGEYNLADVIDVYVLDANQTITRELIKSKTPYGTLSDVLNLEDGLISGVLLPDGSAGSFPSGEVEYCLALAMRDEVAVGYQGLSVGNGITIKLIASQCGFENDNNNENTVVNREKRILPSVVTDLPESALASAPGVTFSTSPYSYTNKHLFAGKHITRIGIPVKTVKALDDNQTFTLSVVKTTSNTYEYVSQNVLTLPREELGDFNTVNKWIYVDVDLHLAEDETLAFGMPTDTVEWGYSTSKNSTYTFRSSTGSWTTLINQSILFDVYATETLEFKETEHGLACVTKKSALPNVLSDFPESAISGGNDVEFATPPYSYLDQTLFSGSRIVKIGIPVKRVAALDENQTFTLSVIKTNAGSGAYQYVSQHTLTLPLDQLGDSTTVNKWIYLDLDLQLADDETLAFGGKNDTVVWGWKRSSATNVYSFRNMNGGTANGIFFDIQTETVITYEDYLKEVKEEQDRLEAEQAQAKLDAKLREVLSGKGISILGDSISTYGGWSNNTSYNSTIGSNAVYYNGSRDGFNTVKETWWMQTIDRAGLELVVNNSWSGDEVTGRGVGRARELHNNSGREPDIIAVYLGINDLRRGKTVEAFATKYEEMIVGMLETYQGKDVYLFTLLYTTNLESSSVNPDDVEKFNDVIRSMAEKYDCTLVDLYKDTGINKNNLATYMGDRNLHPNYAGMDKITQCFMDALVKNYIGDTE